jgi:hypothetical protein
VTIHPSITAIPAPERRRAPSVPTYESDYDTGAMCVVEATPKHSHIFTAAAAIQVMANGRLKFHAAFELERWLPTGNEHRELWRWSQQIEADSTAAEQSVDELTDAMLDQLEPALNTFDQQRGQSPSKR